MARPYDTSNSGRPPFDWTEEKKSRLKELALMPRSIITVFDVGRILGCCARTVERFCHAEFGSNFTEYRKKRTAELKSEIFLTQVQMALKSKDRTMLIWLGKCFLGQMERVVNEQVIRTAESSSEKKAQLVSEVKELFDTMKECRTEPNAKPPQIQ